MHFSITFIYTYICIRISNCVVVHHSNVEKYPSKGKKKKKTITLHVSKTCHETCIAGPGFSKGG